MFKFPLAGLALTVMTVALAWTWNAPEARGQVPAPGLNFSLSIVGVPGCDTAHGDVTCNLVTGTPFTLHVNLVSLPTGTATYEGFDIYMTYSGVAPTGSANLNIWPDCAFPAPHADPANHVIDPGCAIGLPPAGPSSYLGPITSVPFTCTQSGNVILSHASGNTDLVVTSNAVLEPSPADTLTINCSSGPGAVTPLPGGETTPGGPTATRLPPTEEARVTATARVAATATAKAVATAAKKTPTGTSGGKSGGGGGIAGWAIALIVVGAIVGVGGAGYAGWRYWQSRTPSGGGAQ